MDADRYSRPPKAPTPKVDADGATRRHTDTAGSPHPIPTKAPTKASTNTPTSTHAQTVLLVDDDPITRLLTIAALTERGWRVVEADSGATALERFARELPPVVVVDALMPGMDGFELCARLRKLPGGLHVPVLMLTGLDDEASIARAYEAGATDFFIKSTNQWTLLSERLRYMLRAARLREELAQSQATLNRTQRIARLGNWSLERRTRRFRLSDECSQVLGLPANEGLYDYGSVWTRIDPERTQILARYRKARRDRTVFEMDLRIRRPNGESRIVRVEAEIDTNEAGRVRSLRGVLQDVSERRQSEEKIHQLANYDVLTGLPNRRCFQEQFNASLERARHAGQTVAVLYLDLDRFKQINDTLGHQVGDEILREIANRLSRTVRESDVVARASHDAAAAAGEAGLPPAIATPGRVLAGGGRARKAGWGAGSVARLGGDEFTLLLTELADAQIIDRVAARLLDVLRQPVQVGEDEVFVSGSIGAAIYPRDGTDADTLIRKADIAMYSVKEEGRNGWRVFSSTMASTATAERWRVESALHRALERNELVLEYQPKVNVATGEIVGAEALMRWHHEGQLVPPSAFIAVAEDSGLIVPLTEWAIHNVCDQLCIWQKQGLALVPISINISSRHVQRANLFKPVHAALERTSIPAGLIELELTETVLMHNLTTALPLLQSLKQLGVSLSIDDFGTGYSSLAYLKRLPIDTLKIDRSFVRDLDIAQGGDGAAIVAAIIAMSKSLKLRVVAEGVETRDQMQRLFEQGCQLMQGWLFAKSLSQDHFLQLLQARRRDPQWQVQFETRTGVRPSAPQTHSNGTHFGVLAHQGGTPSAVRGRPPTLNAPHAAEPAPTERSVVEPPMTPSANALELSQVQMPQMQVPGVEAEDSSAVERARRWAHRFLGRER